MFSLALSSPISCPVALCRRGPRRGLPRLPRIDRKRNLTLLELLRFANGIAFAKQIGLPLNTHITVTWNRAPGFSLKVWSERETRLRQALGRWLERRGVQAVSAYVRENCRGRGPHTHLLIHLPQDRWHELAAELHPFLLRSGGFHWDNGVRITGDARGTPGMVTWRQTTGLFRYLAKGIDPKALVLLGTEPVFLSDLLGVRPEPLATVALKRVGTCEALGPKARKAAGWKELRHPLDLLRFLEEGVGATSSGHLQVEPGHA